MVIGGDPERDGRRSVVRGIVTGDGDGDGDGDDDGASKQDPTRGPEVKKALEGEEE
jgi:hypothetical protein